MLQESIFSTSNFSLFRAKQQTPDQINGRVFLAGVTLMYIPITFRGNIPCYHLIRKYNPC